MAVGTSALSASIDRKSGIVEIRPQTGVPVHLTMSMNSHGIYSINLPD
jgi:hypothetical protein